MGEYPFIETPAALEELVQRLAREKVIAVDTEADSFFHYHDKLCLLQISARCGTFLIDPLALPPNGLAPLVPIFEDPGIRKVFHAAEYDLYVLQRRGGIRVRNLFDTMISAQLLGYPAVGLGALVERHFDVKLSKDQQRTDWSRRPLRPAQVEYAAADVLYLVELSKRVERELRGKKRLHWATAEFEALEGRSWPEREFDELGYLKIKGAKKLSARELAVLRELFLMRDRKARAVDRPPFKVLGNGTLIELAQRPVSSRRSLAQRKGITDLVIRRMGQDILEAIGQGTEGDEHPPLERRSNGATRRRLDRRAEARLEQLKSWRKRRAAELELDPGVFCPNSSLEAIAAAHPTSVTDLKGVETIKGWWVDEFGAECLEVIERVERKTPPDDASSAPAGRKRSRGRRRGRSRS